MFANGSSDEGQDYIAFGCPELGELKGRARNEKFDDQNIQVPIPLIL